MVTAFITGFLTLCFVGWIVGERSNRKLVRRVTGGTFVIWAFLASFAPLEQMVFFETYPRRDAVNSIHLSWIDSATRKLDKGDAPALARELAEFRESLRRDPRGFHVVEEFRESIRRLDATPP